jgi:hypothetical protein
MPEGYYRRVLWSERKSPLWDVEYIRDKDGEPMFVHEPNGEPVVLEGYEQFDDMWATPSPYGCLWRIYDGRTGYLIMNGETKEQAVQRVLNEITAHPKQVQEELRGWLETSGYCPRYKDHPDYIPPEKRRVLG